MDYPSLDKAVGRSANRRWREYGTRKEVRDEVRKETGSIAISETREGPVAADPNLMRARETGLSMFKKAKGE